MFKLNVSIIYIYENYHKCSMARCIMQDYAEGKEAINVREFSYGP